MQEPQDHQRILVLRRGALGDSICFLPILHALRVSWPAARIDFAGAGEVAALFEERGVVQRGLSSETLGLWRLQGTAGPRAGVTFAGWDRLVGDLAGLDRAGLPAATSIDVRIDEESDISAPAQLVARARRAWPVAWPEIDIVPRLPAERSGAAGRIWLHPGSGSPRKNWPGFAALAARLTREGFEVAVSWGEADDAVRARLRPRLGESVEQLDRRPLRELARCLASAAVFVGNDCGVTHLAAALGVPTVALFGPTRPAVWAPLGTHVRVVPFGAGGEAEAEARAVYEAVRAQLRGSAAPEERGRPASPASAGGLDPRPLPEGRDQSSK